MRIILTLEVPEGTTVADIEAVDAYDMPTSQPTAALSAPKLAKVAEREAQAFAELSEPVDADLEYEPCPRHGSRYMKPSTFGGYYCATKPDGKKWCGWRSRPQEEA
jgi:hypothetical protein